MEVKRSFWSRATFVYIFLFVAALIWVFPIGYMGIMSVLSPDELYQFPPTLWPRQWQFSNYADALIDGGILTGLKNSLIITLGTLVLSISVSILAAYPLAKYEFGGKTILLLAILATQLIPGMAALVPLFDILQSLNLVDTYTGLILIFAARTVPLNIWIIKGFFQAVPDDLTEAALIDGCTRFSALYKIVLPLALPGIGAACMFTFMQTWIDFIVPLTMLFDESKFPFTVMLYKFFGDPIAGTNYGILFASAVIGTLPTLTMFIVFQRFFVQGLTSGGVKG